MSPGCDHCFAEPGAARFGFGWEDAPRRVFGPEYWDQPRRWDRRAARDGRNALVFCASMCDVFEDHPTVIKELEKLWPVIRATPNLTWQLLTKRPHRIVRSLPPDWGAGYDNVWLGTSIEGNEFSARAKMLTRAPARCHFVSYEPALGPLDRLDLTDIEWVIFGGESGPGFRRHDPQWARDMRDRCRKEGVAFFYKQGSGPRPGEHPALDGVEHREFPIGYRYVPLPEKRKKTVGLPMATRRWASRSPFWPL